MSDSSSNGQREADQADDPNSADILDGKINVKSSIHPSLIEDDPTHGDQVTNVHNDAFEDQGPRGKNSDPQSSATHQRSQTDSRPLPNGSSQSQRTPSATYSRRQSVDEVPRSRRQGSVSRRYKRTACFVHSLLEVQQRFERTNLSAIPGSSESSSRAHSPPSSGAAAARVDGRDTREAREAERQASDTKRDLFTHLSKKEISDMALGVRELSKHLGSARLKLNIHHILIVTKTGDTSLIALTRDLAAWLLAQKKSRKEHQQQHHNGGSGGNNSTTPSKEEKALGYTVYIEKTLEQAEGITELMNKEGNSKMPGKLKFWTPELCTKSPHLFDFVITLGGDGTVLYSSWLFQRIVPPVLSFALGSLGFMTTFNFEDHEAVIEGVLTDGVTAALRMRIECTVYRANRNKEGKLLDAQRDLHEDLITTDQHGEDSEPTHCAAESFTILNDLVVDRGPNPFMSSTELYGDDEHLTSIAADGVVISTPTGSTAYSLSAGGSLCHPEIPAILVSPICPHTLSFRPLLVPDSMVLRVAVPYDSRSTAWASFDGRNRVELKQGDYVRISASRFPFPTCLRTKQTGDWFESISRTLNWNERKKQKST